MQPLFGSCLVTALSRCSHMTSEGYLIPAILAVCFNEIEARGLDLEGLFRKSGSAATVNRLQLEFEQDENAFRIKFPSTVSSHSLAGLFKRYLQLLPDPIIPKHCQKQFLKVYDENIDKGKEVLKKRIKQLLCKSLPYEHLHLLQFLVSVADKIQRNQEKNQMTIESLAIIFAPTCVRINPDKAASFYDKMKKCLRPRKKQKLINCYQDLIQLDLMKESIKWTKLFELILSDPNIFANLTRKVKTPPPMPIIIEKATASNTSATASRSIDSTPFWNVPIDTKNLEFSASHEIIKNFESFDFDIQSLGTNEKHPVAQK